MREVVLISLILFCLCDWVESKYCTYSTTDGYVHSIICKYDETCCGNACCKSNIYTFYHLWYFWLTLCLIMLFCSGGSWWYRLRYRNQFFNPRYTTTTLYGGAEQRHQPGVMYYTTVDRVILQHPPKDVNVAGQVVAPPSYAQANAAAGTAAYASAGPSVSTQLPAFHPGPPPPYEAVVDHTSLSPQPYPYPLNASPNVDPQNLHGQLSSQTPLASQWPTDPPPHYR